MCIGTISQTFSWSPFLTSQTQNTKIGPLFTALPVCRRNRKSLRYRTSRVRRFPPELRLPLPAVGRFRHLPNSNAASLDCAEASPPASVHPSHSLGQCFRTVAVSLHSYKPAEVRKRLASDVTYYVEPSLAEVLRAFNGSKEVPSLF